MKANSNFLYLIIVSLGFVPWITKAFFWRNGSSIPFCCEIIAFILLVVILVVVLLKEENRKHKRILVIAVTAIITGNWFAFGLQKYLGDYLYFKQRQHCFFTLVNHINQNPLLKEFTPGTTINEIVVFDSSMRDYTFYKDSCRCIGEGKFPCNHLSLLLTQAVITWGTYDSLHDELEATDCYRFFTQTRGLIVFENESSFGRKSGFAYSPDGRAPASIKHRRYYWHRLMDHWFVWYFH